MTTLGSIGYNLRLLRFKRNLTQSQVAEGTEISVNSISRYERNQRIPKEEDIQKFANFYEVEVEEILINAHSQES